MMCNSKFTADACTTAQLAKGKHCRHHQ